MEKDRVWCCSYFICICSQGWRRIGSGAARTLYVSARRAVVKQIDICKIRYYQHQMSQCDGDQRRTFVFLNNFMGRTLDPALPTSSSDDELASRFSDFFRMIIHIRREIDASVVNQEFSVDFPLRFTRSFTFSHFRSVTEADVLRYIRETRKTCSLDLSTYQSLVKHMNPQLLLWVPS